MKKVLEVSSENKALEATMVFLVTKANVESKAIKAKKEMLATEVKLVKMVYQVQVVIKEQKVINQDLTENIIYFQS